MEHAVLAKPTSIFADRVHGFECDNSSTLLTILKKSAYTHAHIPVSPEFAGALEDQMSTLRSHIVAKAAIERPFTRSSDCARMSVTKQGLNYPTQSGTAGLAARAQQADG